MGNISVLIAEYYPMAFIFYVKELLE